MKKIKLTLVALLATLGMGVAYADLPASGAQGYFYDSVTGKFLSYGVSALAQSNDGAVVDFYGRPFTVTYKSNSQTTFSDGVTIPSQAYVQRIDRTGNYLLCNGTGVVCVGSNYKAVGMYEVDGKLVLRAVYDQGYAKKGWFFAINANDEICLVEGVENATKWEFVDGARQQEIVAAAAQARLVTEAAKAGLTVTSLTELETTVAGMNSKDLTDKISNPTMYSNIEGWNVNKLQGVDITNGSYTIQNASPTQSFTTQTVTGLPSGIYKVTVQAFYRPAQMSICVDMGSKGIRQTNAYFKANDNQTLIKDWYDIRTADDAPNSRGNFKNEFNTEKYTNTVYAYVGSDGNLDLTIAVPSYDEDGGGHSWICFNDVKMTYYYESISAEQIAAVKAQIPTEACFADYKTAATTAVATLEGDPTLDNYLAALEAVATANKSVETYKTIQAALDANVTDYEALSAAGKASYDNDIADIRTGLANGTISGDGKTELAVIEKALATAKALDLKPGDTVEIVNADFETWEGSVATGWSGNVEKKSTTGNTCVTMNGGQKDTYQILKGLHAGIYKLEVQAFSRTESNGPSMAAAVEAGTVSENKVFMYANDTRKNVCLISDDALTSKPSAGNWDEVTIDGVKHYMPSNGAASAEAFKAGYYKNTMYCEVGDDGTLKIGICQEGDKYFGFDNFCLTYIGTEFPDEDVAAIIAEVPTGKMAADAQTALDNAVTAFQTTSSSANYNTLKSAIDDANASIDAVKNYETAIAAAKATAAKTDAMNKDVMPALNTAIAANDVESFPTTAEYKAATTALNNAANNVNNSINDYAATKAAIDNIETYLSRCEAYETTLFEENDGATILAEVKTAYENGTMTGNQASKLAAPYLVAAKAKYAGGTDVTGQAPEKWTNQGSNPVAGWACPDAEGSPERYNNGPFTGDVMTMTMTGLETGTYVVKMIGGASYTSGRGFTGAIGQNHAYFFANDALQSLEVYDRSSIGAGTVECASLTCGVKDGTLKFGIQNITAGANWFVINLISVTKIADTLPATDVTLAVGESGYATFIAPFEYEVPTGVEAYTVDALDADGQNLVMTKLTTVPANTPVVLTATSAISTTVSGVSEAASQNYTVGLLTGVYGDTEITDGYVLQNQGGEVKFYAVSTENPKTVPANHAFLTVKGSEVKAFGFDAIATAIQNLKVADAAKSGAIYNLAGQQLNGLQKGVNIVGGKKVLVK